MLVLVGTGLLVGPVVGLLAGPPMVVVIGVGWTAGVDGPVGETVGDGVGSGGAQPVKLRMRTARAASARGGGVSVVAGVRHGRRGLGTPRPPL